MLPEHLKDTLELVLSQERHSRPVHILSAEAVTGGCIHQAQVLRTTVGEYFLKYNCGAELPNFQAEMRGLKLLQAANSLRTPQPIQVGQSVPDSGEPLAFFLMEYIVGGTPDPTFWSRFGRELAALHQHVAPQFGLDHDNYIGRLVQKNSPSESWTEFFSMQRLEPQLVLAEQNGLAEGRLRQKFEQLYHKLPELFSEEKPSLLHGDLWSGNFIIGPGQQPILIDPAIYYGHREAEIAFTQLFGGFQPQFYAAYQEALPLVPGWKSRVDLFNLYPLAVHLNLFGHSYLPEIHNILRKFI